MSTESVLTGQRLNLAIITVADLHALNWRVGPKA